MSTFAHLGVSEEGGMDHTGLLPRSHSGLAADPNPLGSGYWLFDKSSPLSAPPVSYDSDLIPTLTL